MTLFVRLQGLYRPALLAGPQLTLSAIVLVAPLAMPLICPPLKFGWLNRLKKSKRNWMVTLSFTFQFLSTEKSVLTKPGPWQKPIGSRLFGMVPMVYPTSVTAFGFSTWEPLVPAWQPWPLTRGRWGLV